MVNSDWFNIQSLYFYPVLKGLQVSKKKIVILGTGGTIAGTSDDPLDHTGYSSAQVGIRDLLAAIPCLTDADGSGERYLVEQVAQLDSKDMGFEVWTRLAQRVAHFLMLDEVQGIVITHGTDTLEETAYFLQSLLAPAKPVVLTCAMCPGTALVPDGPQNLVDALVVASSSGARGVTAVCAGTILSAHDVQKIHPYRLDAFGAGDAGPVGYVEQGQLRLLRDWPQTQTGFALKAPSLVSQLATLAWPRVEILTSCVGVDGTLVRALMAAGAKGLVVAATGNGTVHQDLEAALLTAMEQGVKVVRATRCMQGQILPGRRDALPAAPGLTPVKARIEMMLELLSSNHLAGENAALI